MSEQSTFPFAFVTAWSMDINVVWKYLLAASYIYNAFCMIDQNLNTTSPQESFDRAIVDTVEMTLPGASLVSS